MNASRTITHDPVALTSQLIQCPSVTPEEGGALDLLQNILEPAGFHCKRYPFEDVDNLYARFGEGDPHLCFLGHTDVVPPGDAAAWKHPPFSGLVKDDILWGRGAADMKGGVAAFVIAALRYLQRAKPSGSISFVITGDEEGKGDNGTRRLLPVLKEKGEVFSHCLVGEPTSVKTIGDIVKIGRRGSLNAHITVLGQQGHVAYPERAKNPIPALLNILDVLRRRNLDDGTTDFQPSNLEITTIDVGNPTHNIIPDKAEGLLNIRFNTVHKGADLAHWIEEVCAQHTQNSGVDYKLITKVSGEAFLTEKGPFTCLIQDAIKAGVGLDTVLSTSGGTSDARFMKDYAPVAELGLLSHSIHQVDEHTPVRDLQILTSLYEDILERYFKTFSS